MSTKHWLISYQQSTYLGDWLPATDVSDVHPSDWLVEAKKEYYETVILFAMPISAKQAKALQEVA